MTITLGSNRLTSVQTLGADIADTLAGNACRGQVPPLWDGRTAQRVLEGLQTATPS